MKKQSKSLRACYDKALADKPDHPGGRVELEWSILKDGKVGEVTVVSTTLKHKVAEQCLIDALRAMPFEPPVGGSTCTQSMPLVFSQAR